MTQLGDFNSYDLGRVLEALRAEVAEHPEQRPGTALRTACIKLLSWDHRWRTCWNDPTFTDRFTWLRETLNIETNPTLADTIRTLASLVDQLASQDLPEETPF